MSLATARSHASVLMDAPAAPAPSAPSALPALRELPAHPDLAPAQQAAVLAAIDAIQELLPSKPPTQQEVLRAHLGTLRLMVGIAEPRPPSDDEILRLQAIGEEPLPAEAIEKFGQALRVRREQAGLGRGQLASLAGLSESTLRNLEAGRFAPSRMTVFRLLGVPELKLQPADLPWRYNHGVVDPDFAPNCWLAPGFDPIKMVKDLAMHVNGHGGHIEQTHMYLDPMSAACWCAIADQEDYAAAYGGIPYERAAAQILKTVGRSGLDVIALGPGAGKSEVRLADHLTRNDRGDFRLYLLDISQPLLSAAYRHAAEVLASRRGVYICGIQGNFHHLPCYGQLLYRPQNSQPPDRRTRLVCMLGWTFGNLQNEVLFVRNTLGGLQAGDLLLLHVGLGCAPIEQPDEIRRRDVRLSGRFPGELEQRWREFLSGPFRRYADVSDFSINTSLDMASCPVPRSYAIELRANVRYTRGESRDFSLLYTKRYEIPQLALTMREAGWDPVDGWRYGSADQATESVLYLFRKRA